MITRKAFVKTAFLCSIGLNTVLGSLTLEANCIDRYRASFKSKRNWSIATAAGTTMLGILAPPTLAVTIPAGGFNVFRMGKKGHAYRDVYLALKDAHEYQQTGQSEGRFDSFHRAMSAGRRIYRLGAWNRERFVQELMKANQQDLFCKPDTYNPKIIHLASRTDVVALMIYAEMRRQDISTMNVGSVKRSDDYKRIKAQIKTSAKSGGNHQASQYQSASYQQNPFGGGYRD